jgi:DNA integrity scanning protein DisA with diadenylate cyclase activity
MFYGNRAYVANVEVSPDRSYPPQQEVLVHNSSGMRFLLASRMAGQFRLNVVVDKICKGNALLALAVSSLVDRYSKTVTGLPSIL